MTNRLLGFALLALLALLSACASDPARDRPIEPWAGPEVEPTTQIGDDGGGWAPAPGQATAAADAGAPKPRPR